MTITTKYGIGDEVWAEWFTIPIKMVIKSIEVRKDEYTEDISYFVVNPNDRRECYNAEECDLFLTKEELLKNLNYDN